MSNSRLRMGQIAQRERADALAADDDGSGSATMPVTVAQIGERLCAFNTDVVGFRRDMKRVSEQNDKSLVVLEEIRDLLKDNGEQMKVNGQILYQLAGATALLKEQGNQVEAAVRERVEQVERLAGDGGDAN